MRDWGATLTATTVMGQTDQLMARAYQAILVNPSPMEPEELYEFMILKLAPRCPVCQGKIVPRKAQQKPILAVKDDLTANDKEKMYWHWHRWQVPKSTQTVWTYHFLGEEDGA